MLLARTDGGEGLRWLQVLSAVLPAADEVYFHHAAALAACARYHEAANIYAKVRWPCRLLASRAHWCQDCARYLVRAPGLGWSLGWSLKSCVAANR